MVKIALGQINPTVGDFSGNAARMIDFAGRARTAGAGLILFPELAVCGYPPRDLVERPSFVARNRGTVERIAAETRGIAVICGLVTPAHAETGKSVMNSAALLKDGAISFLQSKMLLPTYDVFDEMRNFAPARSQALLPFGGKQMALTICEDAWNDKHFWNKRLYTVDPVEALVQAGGNFVLNISASPFWLGTRDYVRKCGFERVIIGLSGGIDSALTACIAAEALGPANVIGVGMPGPYSSPGSIDDARSLAGNLGIRFELLCITEIFESYRKTLQRVFAG